MKWFGRPNRAQIRAHWKAAVWSFLKHQTLSKSVHWASRTVLSKLENFDFLMKILLFSLVNGYYSKQVIFTMEKIIFSSKTKVFPTLKGPFSKLSGPISIMFGVLESSKRLLSSAHEFGADSGDQTTSSRNEQKLIFFYTKCWFWYPQLCGSSVQERILSFPEM